MGDFEFEDGILIENFDGKDFTGLEMSSVFDLSEITLAKSPADLVLASH